MYAFIFGRNMHSILVANEISKSFFFLFYQKTHYQILLFYQNLCFLLNQVFYVGEFSFFFSSISIFVNFIIAFSIFTYNFEIFYTFFIFNFSLKKKEFLTNLLLQISLHIYILLRFPVKSVFCNNFVASLLLTLAIINENQNFKCLKLQYH